MKIDSIKNGIVLDHITAGKSLEVYKALGLDKLDCSVAIIKNVKSNKMGKKDILKIDEEFALDFDVLGYLDEIPVCVGYEINGEVTTDFPTTGKLEIAKPVLKTLPGWKTDIRGIRNYEELPENCRNYIEFVEEQIGYPITMVSNGPGRNDIIYRESKLSK